MAAVGDRNKLPTIIDASAWGRAADALSHGDIVALPTETVYGLAADATNGKAVARIYAAKGRPSFNPLICHVASLEMAQSFAQFDAISLALAKAFWPGPLTLVLPLLANHSIHPLVTAGLASVAVRMPLGIARDIIDAVGKPLAAPSANISGTISPTSAQAVAKSLGDQVKIIVDGGPSAVGLESTIVKIAPDGYYLLRPGGVPVSDIEHILGAPLHIGSSGGSVEAPGQLLSHYAPRAPIRLNIDSIEDGEALLAFGPERVPNAQMAVHVANLSPSGDLVEAAANLFAMMARLDETGAATIAVEPIPMGGLGDAINDRLSRAATPRSAPINEKVL